MTELNKKVIQLAKEFEMMRIEDCSGVRVGTITEKTNLSLPYLTIYKF